MAWFLATVTAGLGLIWVLLVELTTIPNGLQSGAFQLNGIASSS